MNEWASAVAVVIIGLGIAVWTFARDREHAGWLVAAYFVHLAAAIAFVRITVSVYASGDMSLYFDEGVFMAHAMDLDFALAFPEVISLIFHQPTAFDQEVIGAGSGTGSMSGIAALLVYTLGESVYAVSLCFSIWSYFGGVALFRAFRSEFPYEMRRALLVATLFVPSVVYWTGGILKESVAMGALGFLVVGTKKLLSGRFASAVPLILLAGVPIAFVKPYVLFAFVVAASVWLYAERVRKQGGDLLARPAWLVLGASVAFGGVLALGRIFPQFSLSTLAVEAARLQEVGQIVVGGSSYTMGDPTATTFAGQLVFVPFGIFSTLFRPLPTEVTNMTMALAALETTATSALLVRGLVLHGVVGAVRRVTQSPPLLFCVAFAIVFAAAVGLSTTNLGTLSRYRVPLMPFFLVPVLALNFSRSSQRVRQPQRQTASGLREPKRAVTAGKRPSAVPFPRG